ncbi:kynureninase [Aulographum hederae CBS 113979]|uniref:Kynureninase n=1 Tax=Aulographum hederae CBS 113979 TaxID=1176131 RepID=A0A6G1H2H9_9PEZI|nr:kynureninase [Aulographum hederae CBS 113979]
MDRATNDSKIFNEQYAISLDDQDPLRHLRNEFIIPSKDDLKRKRIAKDGLGEQEGSQVPSTYLCGNSLGLQPRRTSIYIQKYLQTWATQGVMGHFKPLEDAVTPPWLNIVNDESSKEAMGRIVGAKQDEVAIMQTLTANLHFLLASFFKPTKEKYKIVIESKAFPSDHYAVLSHLAHHALPSSAMITIDPPSADSPLLPTSHIISVIDEHAADTALILLPGIQFYTGQFFDIKVITAHAHSLGITIGWDLAHAVGNVPLQLHDWDVDFAAWCSYKYLNSGPGAIAGLFVHENHGKVGHAEDDTEGYKYLPRLSGWWGSDKGSRFAMTNEFVPIPGAAGWQLSNPSAIDSTAVLASLSVFSETSMDKLRQKSLKLTAYLEHLLTDEPPQGSGDDLRQLYTIITPRNPEERGAQLSVRLRTGLLDSVLQSLEDGGVVVDERKPDVIRVAPAPLYNTFEDVWRFVSVFQTALREAHPAVGIEGEGGVMVDGGKDAAGWGEVK